MKIVLADREGENTYETTLELDDLPNYMASDQSTHVAVIQYNCKLYLFMGSTTLPTHEIALYYSRLLGSMMIVPPSGCKFVEGRFRAR